jgi:replicative DNA helicase
MAFSDLRDEVIKGREGRNGGIPMGFNRLNHYIGIRKSMYYLIGGLTGSGKTSFIDDAFVLNPVDWYIANKDKTNIKLKIIYRSMERSRTYKIAKWVSRKIFIDHGKSIPVSKLLGWNDRMNDEEFALFESYANYIKELEEIITIIDGPENPVGIAKELKEYALEHGDIIQVDKYNKKYVPHDENVITLVVIDHIGLLKAIKDYPTKKSLIDKMSDELRYARDFFGFSPVVVSQFNRDISNINRIKNGDLEPQLEDFADSSSTQNDADVVIALFDPVRYKVPDPSGYDTNKLVDSTGAKFYRSVRVIKNSYGSDDIRIGLGFYGEIGMFKELKKKKDMTDEDYANVLNKSWFIS